MFICFVMSLMPGIMPMTLPIGPSFFTCAICAMKSSSVNFPFSILAWSLAGLLLVELLHRLVHQADDVAHAQDALGHALGAELFQRVELLADAQELHRLAGDHLRATAAPRRACRSRTW